jgi:hypothetical protein
MPPNINAENPEDLRCTHCSALISPGIAKANAGLCFRCVYLPPCRSSPPLILVDSQSITFAIPAAHFLAALEGAKGIGGPNHPNAVELEAQRALIRHAISILINRKLNDDLWQTTSEVAARVFEGGIGVVLSSDGEFRFADINRTRWEIGSGLMASGGFAYVTTDGREIYRRQTWMS